MLTLSNGLSLSRAPLAFLFLQDHIGLRLTAIFLAMFTDSIDGYLARKYHSTSKFGAVIDPLMDKFFVYFVLAVFLMERRISTVQTMAFLSRDFSLILFTLYLAVCRKWQNYEIRAIRWGKITTALQFCMLIGLTMGYIFSWYVYSLMICVGILALRELIQTRPKGSLAA